MSFGLTVEKLFIIGLIAMLVVGPERLPRFAAQFAQFVRRVRDFARGAEARLRDEVGDDFDLTELKKLDPRQYDPRVIIRDALNEEPTPQPRPRPARLGDPSRTVARSAEPTSATFDSEAT